MSFWEIVLSKNTVPQMTWPWSRPLPPLHITEKREEFPVMTLRFLISLLHSHFLFRINITTFENILFQNDMIQRCMSFWENRFSKISPSALRWPRLSPVSFYGLSEKWEYLGLMSLRLSSPPPDTVCLASISQLSEIPFSKIRDALNVALREVCLLVEMCGSKNKKEIDTGGMCGCVLWLLLSISERKKNDNWTDK
jgi:hypothetical protein